MIAAPKLMTVELKNLVGAVAEYKKNQYRLVQIGCTQVADGFELNYSFDKNYAFENLQLKLSINPETVPSVSGIYFNAFLYENETHDLYGIPFENIAIDYKGNFYRMAVKNPFVNPPASFAISATAPVASQPGGAA
ncbi:MAG: NADH-quinone oxidoreductase subunit C [Candidatus Omnitrophica bacterium]|nr:NADH-quinone oxidoreductase subunit C [Candidatus Omnitrophota bacterium]